MVVKSSSREGAVQAAVGWKDRYERQKFLVNSMTSLLSRYGNSIERDQLYSAFLLTLMGQFATGDSCYFTYSPKKGTLLPALAYGRIRCTDLPSVTLTPDAVPSLRRVPSPVPIDELPPHVAGGAGMKFLTSHYQLFAPLFLKEKLVGVLLLGARISGRPYKREDLEVLHSLCAVSATTFNNAILYENAHHSAREVQRLYEVRNEVINRITHEFRTPLTIIKAGVEMMEKEGTYVELVKLFTESEARLEDLINSLLSLSQKSEADGPGDARTAPLPVLHDSIHRYSGAAREKEIQFTVSQQEASTPPVLRMEEADFRTILDALLENAVKFSPPGASVLIEVGRSREGPTPERDGLQLPDWREQTDDLIREYRDLAPAPRNAQADPPGGGSGEYLAIRVSDNGIGIPESDLVSVAEPFRQASNSPDLHIKGKGLGLALAHKVVSRHGGYLCCKSSEGSGATFSVFLPIEKDLSS